MQHLLGIENFGHSVQYPERRGRQAGVHFQGGGDHPTGFRQRAKDSGCGLEENRRWPRRAPARGDGHAAANNMPALLRTDSAAAAVARGKQHRSYRFPDEEAISLAEHGAEMACRSEVRLLGVDSVPTNAENDYP